MLIHPCILAFDSATGPCSVAVWKQGSIAAYREIANPAMQSAQLMPMIEQALAASGIAYKDLSAVACTIGPGSFTGIRVGLAAARGIALAAGIKGMGFSTLEVLAFGADAINQPILALLSAGKGEHYYQGFAAGVHPKPLFVPKVGTLDEAVQSMPAPFITVGNATLLGVEATPITFPRADALAGLAAKWPDPAAALNPFYIRAPDAIPLKQAQKLL